jgi:hypothetical protein
MQSLIGFEVKKLSYANVSLNFVEVAVDLQFFFYYNAYECIRCYPSGSCEKDFSGGSFRRTL